MYVVALVAVGGIVGGIGGGMGGAAPAPVEVALTAGPPTASTSSAAPWVIGAKGAALPVAAAGTVVAAAVAIIVAVLPNQNVQLDAAPYTSGATPAMTSAGPSGRPPASSAGMPGATLGVAPPSAGACRSTQPVPGTPSSVDALSGEGAPAPSPQGSAAAPSKRSVSEATTSPSRLPHRTGQSGPPVGPVAPNTTPVGKPPQTPTTSRTTAPSPVMTTAP